ncbi:hypothetical protein [Glaciecola sp. MF2-115]|jgi:hypothetical protein|uniref:hypothetical protein n=1 Tax=Glaciecola sp. MF2-115 TaxID=3384827 RepID=UPI0039A10CEC
MYRKKLLLSLITLSAIAAAGCSNRAAYEIMQTNKRQACERMAEGQAREDCLRGYQKTYDDYERERNALLGNKKRATPKPKLETEKDENGSGN